MAGSVAVVGGGAAGLAAAWALVRGGAAVTLYEERGEVGGRIRSDTALGATADVSVQLLGSSFDAFFGLLRETGAAARLKRAPGRDALWRRGRPHALTYGSMASMIASSSLPTTLKLRLGARYLPFLKRHTGGLDVNDPARTGGVAFDDRSVAEWGSAEVGDDFVALLAHPLLASYYGMTADEASVALLHGLAQAGLDVRVFAAAGGMGALVADVASALVARGAVLHTGNVVHSVEPVPDGARVVVAGGDAASYDAVVVATPAAVARRLLEPAGELDAWLGGVRNRATVTLALFLDRPLAGDWFGLSFPHHDPIGAHVAALCVQSRKLRGLVPAGREAVVVLPAPQLGERLAQQAPDAVVDALLPWVARALPGVAARIVLARTHVLESGYTLAAPGYIHHIARYDVAWPGARCALAGDYLYAPTVEGAARSGIAAARRLLDALA